MKQKIKNAISGIRDQYARYGFYARDKWMVKKFNLPNLSRSEIDEVERIWPFLDVSNKDLIWTRMYKQTYGFSPYFITDYHLNPLLKKLNDYTQVVSLENKALTDIYLPQLPLPYTYVRCINGSLYDHILNPITAKEAYNILHGEASQFIVKPSIETMGGRGVEKLTITNEADFEERLKKKGNNFIIQELLEQNEFLRSLNPTSINSCRVTSILIDGIFTYSAIIKIGRKNSVIDNWNSSIFWGMDNNGVIKEYGFDSFLDKHTSTDSGFQLSGTSYPGFDKIRVFVEESHRKCYPQCGIVGWDVFIDKNNDVRLIEANLSTPGVVGEQFCSGAFFEPVRDLIVSKFK